MCRRYYYRHYYIRTYRLFAIVIFFTPLLGLFDILIISKMAMLPGSKDTVYDGWTDSNGTTVFVSLEEGWDKMRTSSIPQVMAGYSDATMVLYIGLPALLFLLHIAIGLKLFHQFYDTENRKTGGDDHTEEDVEPEVAASASPDYWPVLYTFVCPPLFLDWEDTYRLGGGGDGIASSWARSRRVLLGFVVLMATENLCLCTPFALLKYVLAERTAQMAAHYFPLLPEESSC